MGLFGQKGHSGGSAADDTNVEHLFDDAFREELKDKARLYFERVINENSALFKQDLDATVAHINTELRQHVARQLDEQFSEINKVNTELRQHITDQLDSQFVEYGKTMKEAQDQVMQSLSKSAQAVEEQHRQLSAALEKSVANQDAMFVGALEENKTRINAIKDAQNLALQMLTQSAQAVQEQQKQLSIMLEKGIDDQKAIFVNTFEQNMARIIEHYLLGALGDQYDMKAQLPAIIKQMEENKQAIADDMKL